MKNVFLVGVTFILIAGCSTKAKEASKQYTSRHLFMDVHSLPPGQATIEDVAAAHRLDLATQEKYGVHFIKYWVDETQGKIYCLAESPDSASVYATHKEAHGLTPDRVEQVVSGMDAELKRKGNLFLDVHYLGTGKISAPTFADANSRDRAMQEKYGVNFVNYWIDEAAGIVMCVAEAPASSAMINTHREAHGLLADEVHLVKQGN